MDFIVDYNAFRQRLRELIDSRGKLIQQVAEETGISKITMSRYLNGHRDPDLKYVVALARYFGVSVDWILGLGGEKFDVLPRETKEFVHLINLASPHDRRVIDAVLCKYRKE